MTMEEIQALVEGILYPKMKYRSLEKDYDISKNTDFSICTKCGGYCCKRCGCHYSPDDFEEISFEYLRQKIEKGYISIDYVDREVLLSNKGVYFLRIRNKGAPIVDVDFRMKAPCILHTDKGCKLTYEDRPSGGKLLIPNVKNGNLKCNQKYDIEHCCYEWKPHQKVLVQLVKYFNGKDFPCSL